MSEWGLERRLHVCIMLDEHVCNLLRVIEHRACVRYSHGGTVQNGLLPFIITLSQRTASGLGVGVRVVVPRVPIQHIVVGRTEWVRFDDASGGCSSVMSLQCTEVK